MISLNENEQWALSKFLSDELKHFWKSDAINYNNDKMWSDLGFCSIKSKINGLENFNLSFGGISSFENNNNVCVNESNLLYLDFKFQSKNLKIPFPFWIIGLENKESNEKIEFFFHFHDILPNKQYKKIWSEYYIYNMLYASEISNENSENHIYWKNELEKLKIKLKKYHLKESIKKWISSNLERAYKESLLLIPIKSILNLNDKWKIPKLKKYINMADFSHFSKSNLICIKLDYKVQNYDIKMYLRNEKGDLENHINHIYGVINKLSDEELKNIKYVFLIESFEENFIFLEPNLLNTTLKYYNNKFK